MGFGVGFGFGDDAAVRLSLPTRRCLVIGLLAVGAVLLVALPSCAPEKPPPPSRFKLYTQLTQGAVLDARPFAGGTRALIRVDEVFYVQDFDSEGASVQTVAFSAGDGQFGARLYEGGTLLRITDARGRATFISLAVRGEPTRQVEVSWEPGQVFVGSIGVAADKVVWLSSASADGGSGRALTAAPVAARVDLRNGGEALLSFGTALELAGISGAAVFIHETDPASSTARLWRVEVTTGAAAQLASWPASAPVGRSFESTRVGARLAWREPDWSASSCIAAVDAGDVFPCPERWLTARLDQPQGAAEELLPSDDGQPFQEDVRLVDEERFTWITWGEGDYALMAGRVGVPGAAVKLQSGGRGLLDRITTTEDVWWIDSSEGNDARLARTSLTGGALRFEPTPEVGDGAPAPDPFEGARLWFADGERVVLSGSALPPDGGSTHRSAKWLGEVRTTPRESF